jgi:hypothetical protein
MDVVKLDAAKKELDALAASIKAEYGLASVEITKEYNESDSDKATVRGEA